MPSDQDVRRARSTPSRLPISGSIFRSTPACDAGTCVIPQFHSSVVVAVHRHAAGCQGEPRLRATPAPPAARRTAAAPTPSASWCQEAMPYAVTTTGEWRSINCLLNKDPEQRNEQRDHHQQISLERRPPCSCAMRCRQAQSSPRQYVEPASASQPIAIHPLMSKHRRADCQNHRHRADHQRRVAHRRQSRAHKTGSETAAARQEMTPLPAHAHSLRFSPGRCVTSSGSSTTIANRNRYKHHVREAHLRQRNLAEEKAAAPKATSQRARREPCGASLLFETHTSTLAHPKDDGRAIAAPISLQLLTLKCSTRRGNYSPAPSACLSCNRTPLQIPADSQSHPFARK